MACLSLKSGRPIAKIIGGEYNGEILHIQDEKKPEEQLKGGCCKKCGPRCRGGCCKRCCVDDEEESEIVMTACPDCNGARLKKESLKLAKSVKKWPIRLAI
jgi:hypothetical protein